METKNNNIEKIYGINKLPPDLLIQIFKQKTDDVIELKTLGLVCKSWAEIIESTPTLRRRLKLNTNKKINFEEICRLLETSPLLRKLELICKPDTANFNQFSYRFFNNICSSHNLKFLNLNFKMCDVDMNIIKNLIVQCKNLHSFTFLYKLGEITVFNKKRLTILKIPKCENLLKLIADKEFSYEKVRIYFDENESSECAKPKLSQNLASSLTSIVNNSNDILICCKSNIAFTEELLWAVTNCVNLTELTIYRADFSVSSLPPTHKLTQLKFIELHNYHVNFSFFTDTIFAELVSVLLFNCSTVTHNDILAIADNAPMYEYIRKENCANLANGIKVSDAYSARLYELAKNKKHKFNDFYNSVFKF